MIIGLSGYARSGKDESFRCIQKHGFQRLAFADPLREFLLELNPIVDFYGLTPVRVKDVISEYGWGGYKNSPYVTEMRELLQRLGTEAGRGVLGDSIWVDTTLNKITEGNYAITDCRFKNEAEGIKSLGGVIVRIERPGVGPANDHISETDLDDYPWDYLIVNDGDIMSLQNKLSQIVLVD